MSVKYYLVNIMNRDSRRIISTHRSLIAAEKAEVAFDRKVKKSEGQNHWIPTAIYTDEEIIVDGSFVYLK